MCQIFTTADPGLYACRSRSIRLRGVATSVRLENIYWQALEEIGARDGLGVPQLVARLPDEPDHTGALGDRAAAKLVAPGGGELRPAKAIRVGRAEHHRLGAVRPA